MPTSKHRFIPLAPQGLLQEVGEQLASQIPVQKKGSLHNYNLPNACEDISLEADNMEKWAEAEQKVILDFERPRYKPQFFQLKKGGDTVWTNKGQTCLLVPFFKGTMEVLVRVLDSDAEYLIKWECGI
ncbi:hypothetical protein QBC46DRAFT_400671 [Diplogelasinospora grovesii]|uniref:Uncharacterized protein n=1 Tax=Diplogelasinospora grovesii TaxID=303347 RepID=A0AAN6MYA4_9PEZI|nr:hypothetical protein QBC46DRAFT_400671 [Diplogelasinospora grovesii]